MMETLMEVYRQGFQKEVIFYVKLSA